VTTTHTSLIGFTQSRREPISITTSFSGIYSQGE